MRVPFPVDKKVLDNSIYILKNVIGEATIADAILDRLVHTSYRIELKGESLRRKM